MDTISHLLHFIQGFAGVIKQCSNKNQQQLLPEYKTTPKKPTPKKGLIQKNNFFSKIFVLAPAHYRQHLLQSEQFEVHFSVRSILPPRGFTDIYDHAACDIVNIFKNLMRRKELGKCEKNSKSGRQPKGFTSDVIYVTQSLCKLVSIHTHNSGVCISTINQTIAPLIDENWQKYLPLATPVRRHLLFVLG